jgi:hypothetical protein
MSVCWQRAHEIMRDILHEILHEILYEILYEILHMAERTCHVEIPFVCMCICVRVLRARAFRV